MTAWTKRLGLLAGAALIIVGLGSAYVHAQNNSGGPGRGGPGRMFGPPPGGRGGPGGPGGPGGFLNPRMMDQLQLTDAQKEQVKAVMDSHRDDMKALGDRAQTAHTALRTAVTGDTFDESAIRTAAAGVAAVDTDMAVLQGRIHGEIWQILTTEQQAKAKTLQAQMEQRMAQGPGGPGGRDGRGQRGPRNPNGPQGR